MKSLLRLAPVALMTPLLASAQVASFGGVATALANFTSFINNVLVPFIFAVAFLVFIWGMFTTFILGGDDEEKQKKGKKLMLYSVIGFVLMVSIWGIVNLIAGGLGLSESGPGFIPGGPVPATPGS